MLEFAMRIVLNILIAVLFVTLIGLATSNSTAFFVGGAVYIIFVSEVIYGNQED